MPEAGLEEQFQVEVPPRSSSLRVSQQLEGVVDNLTPEDAIAKTEPSIKIKFQHNLALIAQLIQKENSSPETFAFNGSLLTANEVV
jgi:hypothetical protein